jgi:benzoyl-CoA reductase/2-hydroxyglutaryl-CoA dehydratase subunit BcrC/BadD/HgdB
VPRGIGVSEWDRRFAGRCAALRSRYTGSYGPGEPRSYLHPPSHWARSGDRRLARLRYDPEPASLALCSFLESQTERLHARAGAGAKVVAGMKDLCTVAAMLAGVPEVAVFAADMAFMQPTTSEDPRFLELAAERGLGGDFCDVRAVVGALADGKYWPRPDLCTAAVGACCDDFSACMQAAAAMGFPVHFWELPEVGDAATERDGEFVLRELEGVRAAVGRALSREIGDAEVAAGLARVNRLRALIREIREMAYSPEVAPLPALECLLVEALAADFGSDLEAAVALLEDVRDLCRDRVEQGENAVDPDAVRLTWVTPSMDVCLQNLTEDLGARVCGTEYMLGHGFVDLDEEVPPLEALARGVLADPMIGSCARRARLVVEEAERCRAEGLVLVSFFGASHCAWENRIIADEVRARLGIPTLVLEERTAGGEIPAQVRGRLAGFVETVRSLRAGRALSAAELDPAASRQGRGNMSKCCASGGASAAPAGVFGRLEDSVLEEIAYAEAEKEKGRGLVGIYCEYTPREVIMAAGAMPVCLCGYTPEMVAVAEEDLPANLCPLIKSSYGYVKDRACPFFEKADAIVAETTCDGKKKMYELIADRHPTFVLELTQKPDSEAAFAHWLGEVRELKAFLERVLGVEITDAKLGEAIRAMNRWRRRHLDLYEFSRGDDVYVTGVERLLVNQRIACSPLEDELLDAVLAELSRRRESGETVAPKGAPRVLVTGVPIGMNVEKVIRLVEESGGIVVVQEACSGIKPLVGLVSEEGDPLEAIARKYFELPCSCFTANRGRFDLLDRLVTEFRPDAVVDVVWMACHTYNVESVLVRRWAAEKGLPFLKVETDYSTSDTEQMRNRVQSLMEMCC